MKTNGVVEVQLHAVLTSELHGGGKWSASRTGRFTPKERTWVGARAGLDTAAKRKIPRPCRDSKPCRPARRPVCG